MRKLRLSLAQVGLMFTCGFFIPSSSTLSFQFYSMPSASYGGGEGYGAESTQKSPKSLAKKQQPDSEQSNEQELSPEEQKAAEEVAEFLEVETIERESWRVLRGETSASKKTQAPENPSDADSQADKAKIATIAEFKRCLTFGDWGGFKRLLADRPQLNAKLIYEHGLGLLANKGLQPIDIVELGNAFPGRLSNQHLTLLGALLKESLVHVDQPRELYSRLAQGSGQIGGTDVQHRLNAARILFSAGLIDEARKYASMPDRIEESSLETFQLCSDLEFSVWESDISRTDVLQKAWLFTSIAWSLQEDSIGEDAKPLHQRIVRLLSVIPKPQADQWLEMVTQESPKRIKPFAAALLEFYKAGFGENQVEHRKAAVSSAKLIGESLLGKTSDSQLLGYLVTPWLNEVFKLAGKDQRYFTTEHEDQVEPLEVGTVVVAAPSTAWMSKLPIDTQSLTHHMKGLFAARQSKWDDVLESINKLKPIDPKTAQLIADEYLTNSLTGGKSVERQVDEAMKGYQGLSPAQRNNYRRHFRRQFQSESRDGVSLTRARQLKNLERLKSNIQLLTEIGVPPSTKGMVEAMESAYSNAEVFSEEAIELLFGPIESIPVELATKIGDVMRSNLAQIWRDMEVQQAFKTNRTEKELAAEVVSGYELATRLVEQCINRAPQDFSVPVLAGSLRFEQAEYLYGLGSELPEYIELRDRAFLHMELAAESYRKLLMDGLTQPDPTVHLRWFQMALGASDLAYLTRQASADGPQIQKIAESIRQCPKPMGQLQLQLLGAAFMEGLDQVPPQLKHRCLTELLNILGDHPSGQKANELVNYYQSLLAEVELSAEIVGSSNVGYGSPFGVNLSIRYTTALGREADYFNSLIYKSSNENNQEELEKEIRSKLSESFEIVELRFHSSNVKPRPFGRKGWQETPLAFLLLSAKDAKVDTLSSLQVDVGFNDGGSSVLLPITSQKLLIDARSAKPDNRPYSELAVTQIADTQQLADGKFTLEIVASAKGLVPKLEQILSMSQDEAGLPQPQLDGFILEEVQDSGSSVVNLTSNSRELIVDSERNWTLEYKTIANTQSFVDFKFPKVHDPNAKVIFEQRTESESKIVDSTIRLELPTQTDFGPMLKYAGLAGLAVLSLGFGVLWMSRRPRRVYKSYQLPEKLTPFTLVAFLRRVSQDGRVSWSRDEHVSLSATILELESNLFQKSGQELAEDELEAIYSKWQSMAQQRLSLEMATT